jgi:hypothetical protein
MTLLEKVTFQGSQWDCIQKAMSYKEQGFEVTDVEVKRIWPYFWRMTYIVTVEKKAPIIEFSASTAAFIKGFQDAQEAMIRQVLGLYKVPFEDFKYSLEYQLQEAIEREDYEEAARLRDEIAKKS